MAGTAAGVAARPALARTSLTLAASHADAAAGAAAGRGAPEGGAAPFRIPLRSGMTRLWVTIPATHHQVVLRASSRQARQHAPRRVQWAALRPAAGPSCARATGRAASLSPPRRRAAASRQGQLLGTRNATRQESVLHLQPEGRIVDWHAPECRAQAAVLLPAATRAYASAPPGPPSVLLAAARVRVSAPGPHPATLPIGPYRPWRAACSTRVAQPPGPLLDVPARAQPGTPAVPG